MNEVFADTDLESRPEAEPRDFVPNPRMWDHHQGNMGSDELSKTEGSVLYKTCLTIAQECHRKRIDVEVLKNINEH